MPDEQDTQADLSRIPVPGLEGERRKEDRRTADRSGKYDRRKNRCIHCLHFQEQEATGKGLCRMHNVGMVAYAFACPEFKPVAPSTEERS